MRLRLFLTPSNWPGLTPFLVSLLLVGGCVGGEGIILPGAGEPADITVVDGDEQSGRVGEPLNNPLVVQVTDTRGRPVPGATVAFELTSAGSDVVPHEKNTDANGLADARLVLGTTVGRQTGNARVVTQEGRPPVQADFSAMALSENANSMAAVDGQDQSGHVGTLLDQGLVVRVTDGFGNPVQGVPIGWVAEGGGSVSDAVVETDANGRSRVERTLGPTVGQQTTVASAEGLAGSPVTFVHTALAGNASRLVVVSGNGQTATVGSELPADLVVRLLDADGNGVPATAVSWVVATGGGLANPENSITDAGGGTSARWTLGDAVGQQRLDAVVSGVGVATFRADATSRAPASLAIQTQPPASAGNGVPFDQQPVIQLRDGAGNDVGVAGVEISVAIGTGGGALGGTSRRTTDVSGRATFIGLSISGAAGKRTLVFTASGLAGVTSNEIDVIAIGTTTTITADLPDPSFAGSAFPVAFQVASAGPTPTGTVTVTVSGGPATCTGTLSAGAGSCSLTLTASGPRTLTATYSGGPGLFGSADTEPHTVVPQPPPPNQAPTAAFTSNCSDLTCSFASGGSVDPDGNIVSRSWDFGDGTTGSGVSPSHSYATGGTYTVTLTVTDNDGATGTATAAIQVQAPPQLLQLRTQPSGSATVGVPFGRQPVVQLRAGSNDLNRAGVTISVTVASGGGSVGGTTTATTGPNGRAGFSNLSINGATGSHTLTFSADGFSPVTSDPIDVGKANTTTTITGHGNDPSNVGEPVTVQFQVVSSSGTPTGMVTVTVSGGNETCSALVAVASCSITLQTAGNRTLSATYGGDDLFNISSDDVPHTVNAPPTAAFTSSCDATFMCTFTDASSDPGGAIATWSWDFGGASPATSGDRNPSGIQYLAAATYQVTLIVTDNDGATGTITRSVEVPTPP